MATGNGAYIIHETLKRRIPGYTLKGYHPNLTLMPLLLKAINSFKDADLIHTTPDYASFFMRPNVPSVITFHNYVLDSWMMTYSNLFQKIHYKTDLRIFTKAAVFKAHTITAVSRFTAALVKKELGISKKIQVIYNGIDSELFCPQSKMQHGKKICVLFSGNISMRKGAQWLPAIADKLERNIVVYYTSGLRGKGKILERENLIPVGRIPYNDMPDFYNKMHIVLMPTVREGFGLAAAEAMACGLPVIASNCSALPELIDNDKGGFLCPVGDVDAFAEKINFLANSEFHRKEMGEYNRAKVEKQFTIKRMVNGYKTLFEEVVES